MIDISIDQFKRAEKLLQGLIVRSPLLPLPNIFSKQGNPIFLKAENLQPGGAFKIRGASFAIAQLNDEQKKHGIIAYSTGNHAQAVALAAKRQKLKATIVMSPNAPQVKIDAVRNYGAEIIMTEPSSDIRKQVAEDLAQKNNLFLVPPYDDINVITGQGTIGVEILEDVDPEAVFVPVGGGGLISGIALAIKKQNPKVKIIGVEPELENDAYLSFHAKKLMSMKAPSTSIADAVKVLKLGNLTFPLILQYVDDMITVSEQEIAQALFTTTIKSHLIVEPSGALALAGAVSYNKEFESKKPIICIASGGNTTLLDLYKISQEFHLANA